MNLIKSLTILKTSFTIVFLLYASMQLVKDSDLCLEPQLRYGLSLYLVFFVGASIYFGRHFYREFDILDIRRFLYAKMKIAYEAASYQHMYDARNYYFEEFENLPISTIEERYLKQVCGLIGFIQRSDNYDISFTELPCVLCLDLIDVEQDLATSIALPCKHVFHGPCLIEWLKIKYRCPTCKSPLRQTVFDEFMAQGPTMLTQSTINIV